MDALIYANYPDPNGNLVALLSSWHAAQYIDLRSSFKHCKINQIGKSYVVLLHFLIKVAALEIPIFFR